MRFGLLLVCLLTFACENTVNAQFGPTVPGLTVHATESVQVAPENLRLVMKIQASGKDAKAAVKALNQQKEKVREALAEMNAQADSIRFSATQLEEGVNRNVANMMRSMRGQFGPTSEEEDEEQKPLDISTASCMVTSQWALPAKEGDALAILPAMLKQQISTRDLEGKNLKPDLEPEQMEMYEQMAKAMRQQMSYGGEEQGGVRIEYVGKVSAEAAEKAHAKAFTKAKAKAKMLSEASGVALGKLYTVTAGGSNSQNERATYYAYARGMGAGFDDDFLDDSEETVASNSVDGLKHLVSVWLAFHLD